MRFKRTVGIPVFILTGCILFVFLFSLSSWKPVPETGRILQLRPLARENQSVLCEVVTDSGNSEFRAVKGSDSETALTRIVVSELYFFVQQKSFYSFETCPLCGIAGRKKSFSDQWIFLFPGIKEEKLYSGQAGLSVMKSLTLRIADSGELVWDD